MTTWSINQLFRNISDGGVISAMWKATLNDEEYTSIDGGQVYFSPDSSADSFISYSNLTEAKVLEWVQAEVGKDKIENALVADIVGQKTPTTAEGVPW